MNGIGGTFNFKGYENKDNNLKYLLDATSDLLLDGG